MTYAFVYSNIDKEDKLAVVYLVTKQDLCLKALLSVCKIERNLIKKNN